MGDISGADPGVYLFDACASLVMAVGLIESNPRSIGSADALEVIHELEFQIANLRKALGVKEGG
jgi:hypothetical protein